MAAYIALFFSIVSVICISLAVYYYCRFREMSHARYSFEGQLRIEQINRIMRENDLVFGDDGLSIVPRHPKGNDKR